MSICYRSCGCPPGCSRRFRTATSRYERSRCLGDVERSPEATMLSAARCCAGAVRRGPRAAGCAPGRRSSAVSVSVATARCEATGTRCRVCCAAQDAVQARHAVRLASVRLRLLRGPGALRYSCTPCGSVARAVRWLARLGGSRGPGALRDSGTPCGPASCAAPMPCVTPASCAAPASGAVAASCPALASCAS